MEMSSTISNLLFNESAQLISTHDDIYGSSMFPTITEQFYHDYQYNLNFLDYPTNNYMSIFSYQPSSSFIPLQNQMVNTIKIHINPFFRSRSTNRISESSSEVKQEHNSSLSSRSRSCSPPKPQEKTKSSNKKRKNRQKRQAKRKKYQQEKELLCKRQSSLYSSSKFKHHRLSPDRCGHKNGKLERLYKEYSNENAFTQWKPLLLQDCFELYKHAFNKYHGTSNKN